MTISPAPRRNELFAENYDILGEYVQDDSRIPFFNPVDSDEMIEPGEPLLIQWNGGQECMMAQGPIHPGEIGMLNRYFTGDFPCDFSAQVIAGAKVHWDTDNKVVKVGGDVTNGFELGVISWHIDPTIQHKKPAVDGNGRVIAATTDSTKCRVVGLVGQAAVVGSPTVRSTSGAPAAKAAKKKG